MGAGPSAPDGNIPIKFTRPNATDWNDVNIPWRLLAHDPTNAWALTFNAGWNEQTQSWVLDYLDKFATFGLTAKDAKQVAAPLIAECYASLECRVADTRMVNAYGFFVLEVVQAWVDKAVKAPQTIHHRGKGRFMVAGDEIRLPSEML